MSSWDNVFTGDDKIIYEQAGLGRKVGFGQNPALLIIDVMTAEFGDKPEPILESMKHFPQSCGEAAWKAIKPLQLLLSLAREHKIPIIYSDNSQQSQPWLLRKWGKLENIPELNRPNDTICQDLAPVAGDMVIFKRCPSVFFGTHLISVLVSLDIDTLLVCGCTTSGCVRATVIDAASYGFRVAVIEECTFDRIELSHKVSLFDMNAKYADVVSVQETIGYVKGLSR